MMSFVETKFERRREVERAPSSPASAAGSAHGALPPCDDRAVEEAVERGERRDLVPSAGKPFTVP